MISGTSLDEIAEYAGDEQAQIVKPDDLNYSLGVKAGWTAPAAWWNWLFNALTKIAIETRNDISAILAELNNTLTAAGIDPDSATQDQLADAIEKLSAAVATSENLGTVKSSYGAGNVSVDPDTGIMAVNGLGDLSAIALPVQNIVEAIELLYQGLLSLDVGVPIQPTSYDEENPVLDTTTLDDPLELGEINLAAGWYYVKIAGAGGGASNNYNGGRGVLSQSWVFFPTPAKFIYCAGAGGKVGGNNGGTNNFKNVSARLPTYLEGTDTTFTGGSSVLINCATQEVYIASGGGGGSAATNAFALKNTVVATNTAFVAGCMGGNGSEMTAGQRPYGVSGWQNSAEGGEGGVTTSQAGSNGWIQIYRGSQIELAEE